MTEYTLSSYNSLLLLRVVLVTDDDVVGVVLMMGFFLSVHKLTVSKFFELCNEAER